MSRRKKSPCFRPCGPLPMLVQTMMEFDCADKIRIVAHWLFGRQGILHLIMYPIAMKGS